MRFLLTTAIDYVNSRPHLGHALEKTTADVIARYKRLTGYDVRFVMGNDEHSQNVYRRARELGLDPLAYCDQMEREFRAAWEKLDISFDDFIRTTEPRHRAAVQKLVQRSLDAGDIYEGTYKGWYCVSCEAFKQEKDLVDGLCPIHKRQPEWIEEKNYFFRLSAYRDRLIEYYRDHPLFVEPDSRRNEMLRVLEGGLEDISVSRAGQAWGIPLPFDPSSVVYVWYDALINYIAAVGYGTDEELFARWWPADVHLIGKDITRFHCIVWPAMLMSAGLALPKKVFGHGFLLIRGEKMSKSLGTVIDPFELADRVGVDPLRLYLTKEIVNGADGDITLERYDEKYNVDLANNLGNLVSRLTTMVERYRGGKLNGPGRLDDLAGFVTDAVARYRAAMDELALDRGCHEVFAAIDAINQYIATSEPWALAKRGDDEALDRVLWTAVESLRVAAVMLAPVMPRSMETVLDRLGAPVRQVSELRLDRDGVLRANGTCLVTRAESLWPRREAAPVVPKETSMTERPSDPTPPAAAPATPAAAPAPAPAAAAPEPEKISIDDFMKVELRVAKVLSAERVPNSKKLMKLSVDLGSETRTIVAGIADAYEADALVGRTIVVVANLKPAKLMGIESNGMVLAGSPEGGKPVLVGFDNPPPPGSRVR